MSRASAVCTQSCNSRNTGKPKYRSDTIMQEDKPSPKEVLATWLSDVTVPSRDPFQEEELAEHLWGEGEDTDVVGNRVDPTWGREGSPSCRGAERLEGSVNLRWEDGESFTGSYMGGAREGDGGVSAKNKGVVALTGNWSRGELEGKGRLVRKHLNSVISKQDSDL